MRSRLLLLLAAVTLVLTGTDAASAAWTADGAGSSTARASVLAPPSGLTVTGQSCTPTYSGTSTVGYRDGVTANGTDTVTASRPAATVAGDLLVAGYSIRHHAATITPPAGWTQLRLDVFTGKDLTTGIWYRVAEASDPASWTWTASVTGFNAVVALAAYTGVAGIDPSHGVSMQASASITAPSVTPTPAGTRLVGLFTIHARTTFSTPDGMRKRLEYQAASDINGGGNHQMSIMLADESWSPAAAATDTRTSTAANNVNMGHLLALTPTTPPTPSTISYQGGVTGFGAGSVLLTVPSGVQAGDLLLVGYSNRKSAPTVATPTGWTLLRLDRYDTKDYQQAVYWRVATSADTTQPTYQWLSNSTDKAAGAMLVYRGVDQAAPLHLNAAMVNSGNQAVTTPSATPTRAHTRLVGFFGASDGRTVASKAAGMARRQFATSGSGGADVSLEVEDERWPDSDTAIGTRTVTLSGNGRGIGQLVALKPESSPLAHLSWTATTSTYAENYRLGRETGGTETAATSISPITTTTHTTGWAHRLAAGTGYTLRLRSRIGNWISAGDTSTSFTTITTC